MEQNDNISSVRRMQNYIEEHITELITLSQLASAARYSPWYAEKLFKEYTTMAPFDYIRALRLTKAALMLRDGKPKVIDVALDFVFDSHEGFTKAFSKQFGMSPKNYSRSAPPIQLFVPYPANDYRHTKFKGEKTMSENKNIQAVFVQVIERPARKVLLKRGYKADEYFAYCEEVGCDIWGMLTSVREALYEPIGIRLHDQGRHFQVCSGCRTAA